MTAGRGCHVPGIARRSRRLAGDRGGRRRADFLMAQGSVAPWRRCGRAAGRVFLRRLLAVRRDRPVLTGDGADHRRRARRPAGARHLQRFPGAVRGAPAARGADPQRRPALPVRRPGADDREHPDRLDQRLRPGFAGGHPDQERRGPLRRFRAQLSTGSKPRVASSPAMSAPTPMARCATSPASPTSAATWSA